MIVVVHIIVVRSVGLNIVVCLRIIIVRVL